MSYENAKYFQLNKWLKAWVFASGIIDNIEDIDKIANATSFAQNNRYDWQSPCIRPWHQLFATLTAWDYPRWIGRYYRTDPTNDRMVVRHNTDGTHKLYTIDTLWTATSISTGADITSDARMRFLNVADVVYCMNWVDQFGKLSWTTYTKPWTVPSNFAPSFAVPFDWKTVASGWSANPNKIYYSVADNYEDFTSAGTDTGTTIETVTGLASTDQALFYFTTNTISVTDHWDIVNTAGTVSYNSSYLQTKEWSVNHDWIVVVWSKVYFVSPSNTITKVERWEKITWFEPVPLSDREWKGISKFMNSLPKNQTDCWAYLQEDTNLIHWFFKSAWATFWDKCVVYDHVKDIFVSFDTNRFFQGWIFFKGKNYTTSAIESKVFRDEYSYDDQWQSIAWEYRTKLHYLGWWTQDAAIRESRTLLDMNTLARPTQQIRLDWWLVDSDQLTSADLPNIFGWLGTEAVWTYAIGTEWSWWVSPTDYQSVRWLRSKGCFFLNKFSTIQRIRKNQTIWWKVRLKDVSPKVEWVTPMRTPQN